MKRILVLLFVCLLVIGITLPVQAQPQPESNKYAIIIGTDNKPCAPVNGSGCARVLKGILVDAGFEQKNIKFLTNRKAGYEEVVEAFLWLQEVATEDSEIVFAFFGHGFHSAILLDKRYMLHKTIRDLMAPIQSQKQLVLIDSCGSAGAILEGSDGVTLSAPNRIVVTSTSQEPVSSVFTGKYTDWVWGFLIFGMKEGRADSNGDGVVSIQEAYNFAGKLMSDNYGQEYILGE